MIATRSPIVRLGVRAATPPALMTATFLFFAGHNRPGGGFAAGLLLGAVIALRTVAGLPLPAAPTRFLAAGIATIALVALAPIVGGAVLLDQVVVKTSVPLLGTVKAGSALVFDLGVTLVVVGLIVAVLDGLGADELGAAE
ncbi:MAG: MnhB domain-containing protein [Acidimicrobiales bacterium]